MKAGAPVVVLVGAACTHHAQAVDAALLQRLQGRDEWQMVVTQTAEHIRTGGHRG